MATHYNSVTLTDFRRRLMPPTGNLHFGRIFPSFGGITSLVKLSSPRKACMIPLRSCRVDRAKLCALSLDRADLPPEFLPKQGPGNHLELRQAV